MTIVNEDANVRSTMQDAITENQQGTGRVIHPKPKKQKVYLLPSATVEWATPQDVFDKLNAEFGFTIDVAAADDNAKVRRYYTKEIDGLAQSWDNEVVWCNPPYGREIADWINKASDSKATSVFLVPARTDTRWFHDHVYGVAEVRFLKGRLKFGGATAGAPFPSMVIIFRNK